MTAAADGVNRIVFQHEYGVGHCSFPAPCHRVILESEAFTVGYPAEPLFFHFWMDIIHGR